jgi:hypothetical protein
MNPSVQRYVDFLGMALPQWLMGPDERLAVLGLLDVIKPATILEIGHCFGGCTQWLSKKAKQVFSIDIDARVVENCKQWPNVTPLHMSSTTAFEQFRKENARFDLAIIDGDHSEAGACNDLSACLTLCDFIILHDTTNPGCRAGYLRALEDKSIYHLPDLVEGGIHEDGLWGGIGIVIPAMSNADASTLAPKISNYEAIKTAFDTVKTQEISAGLLSKIAKKARRIF